MNDRPASGHGDTLPARLAEQEPWHALPVEEVIRRLGTDPERGLDERGIRRRRTEYGPNTLQEIKGRSAARILLDQLKSLIVALLIAATVVAFALEENIEGFAILVVIVLNTLIGFITEWKAEQALTALRNQAVPTAHVIREEEEQEIPAVELVPGDLVILSAGARVPADGRVVESARLQVQEAALTGESQAVEKEPEVLADADTPLGDRVNMVYLGTAVADGRGLAVVTATGIQTEVGRIGVMIEEATGTETPLEKQLARLGRSLIGIVFVLCCIIVGAGWLRDVPFLYMLEVGISLAIAAVPEGLPAVATMTLALGMQRMARHRALIRRLPVVETLGSTTVICTDKTGTLTRNEMTVRALLLDDRRIDVTGAGYVPEGAFLGEGHRIDSREDEDLLLALRIGALCNDATLDHEEGETTVLGDPTEVALIVAAQKAGLDHDELEENYPRLDEVPFSSESRRMITVHQTPDRKRVAYVKGAPAAILRSSRSVRRGGEILPLTEEDRKHYQTANEQLAGSALRVLALAYREVEEGADAAELGRDLVLVGLVGMIDPLREEARDAILTCRGAGIRTVMLTGDQAATATEIGRQLGLDRGTQGEPLRTVHGRELAHLDDTGWEDTAARAGVFARVSPRDKLRIVEALQRRGEVVAMTGDGVNDAPALKKADVGVAMGIKGTEVAKEAADMIITDDRFETIVRAVEEGRIIYANILRFIHYLFSCNLSEILTVFLAILIGWPLPLAPLQVLWLNMITDVFPAMALALEPSTPDMMTRPPRDPSRPILGGGLTFVIAWQGLLVTGVTLLAFAIGMHWYGVEGTGLRHAVTVAFMTLALAQTVHAFNARSRRRSAFTARLFTNAWLWSAVGLCVVLQLLAVYVPFLQAVLHTTALGVADWALILGCSLVPLVVVEVTKFGRRLKREMDATGGA